MEFGNAMPYQSPNEPMPDVDAILSTNGQALQDILLDPIDPPTYVTDSTARTLPAGESFALQSGAFDPAWTGPQDLDIVSIEQSPENTDVLANLMNAATGASELALDAPSFAPPQQPLQAGNPMMDAPIPAEGNHNSSPLANALQQPAGNTEGLASMMNAAISAAQENLNAPATVVPPEQSQPSSGKTEELANMVNSAFNAAQESFHAQQANNDKPFVGAIAVPDEATPFDEAFIRRNRDRAIGHEVKSDGDGTITESSDSEDSADNEEMGIQCTRCNQYFGDRDSLRRHKARVHKKARPVGEYICDNCQDRFMNKQNLRRHVHNCHTGELMEACDECNATFNKRRSLALHKKRVHGAEPKRRNKPPSKVISCQLCSYTSNQSYNVRRHFRTVHADTVRLPCPYSGCERVCRSQANLHTHLMTCRLRPGKNSGRRSRK